MKKFLITLIAVISLGCAISALAFGPWRMPPGNYQQSCYQCRTNGHQLSCFCKDTQGIPHWTSAFISFNCSFVQNLNGKLQCTGGEHPHHFYPPRPHPPFSPIRDISAGPIWNQGDANQKCPRVCGMHRSRWTGQWHTVVFGRESVCQCQF